VRLLGSFQSGLLRAALEKLAEEGDEVSRLMEENAELETEVERLQDALCNQEFYLVEGYIAAVWPVGDGSFIAKCPTLHAVVQEASSAAAVASLREAMDVVRVGHKGLGRPLPEEDVVTRCLA
jgi:hypothetical protein